MFHHNHSHVMLKVSRQQSSPCCHRLWKHIVWHKPTVERGPPTDRSVKNTAVGWPIPPNWTNPAPLKETKCFISVIKPIYVHSLHFSLVWVLLSLTVKLVGGETGKVKITLLVPVTNRFGSERQATFLRDSVSREYSVKTDQWCCFVLNVLWKVCWKWCNAAPVRFKWSKHCAGLRLKNTLLNTTLLVSKRSYGNLVGNLVLCTLINMACS